MINQVINDWWVSNLLAMICINVNGLMALFVRYAEQICVLGIYQSIKSKQMLLKKYTYLGASLTIAELSKLSGIAEVDCAGALSIWDGIS